MTRTSLQPVGGNQVKTLVLMTPFVDVDYLVNMRCLVGSRRSRNRGRGQILVGNSKPSTLQFEADFDFETANAQFNKDDVEKEIEDQLSVEEGISL